MEFKKVDPTEVDMIVSGTRKRNVSYNLLKAFLETGEFIVEIDPEEMGSTYSSLYSSVSGYAKRNDIPVRLFNRGGRTFLMRLDIDKEGKPVKDWLDKEKEARKATAAGTAMELTPELVAQKAAGGG